MDGTHHFEGRHRQGIATGGGVGHHLRQFSPTGPDTVAISPKRQDFTRGNAYPYGANLSIPDMGKFLIIPNHDCDNAGGEVMPDDKPVGGHAGCFLRRAGGAGPAAGHATGRQARRIQQVSACRPSRRVTG